MAGPGNTENPGEMAPERNIFLVLCPTEHYAPILSFGKILENKRASQPSVFVHILCYSGYDRQRSSEDCEVSTS